MKQVVTIGTFDVPHFGHFNFLRQCAEYGELNVGLNTDEFIEKYKGSKPLFTWEERSKMLAQLPYVKQIFPYNGPEDTAEVLNINLFDIIAIGSDWARKDYYKQMDFTQDDLDEAGISLIYIPYTKEISTTEIKKRVKSNSNSHD